MSTSSSRSGMDVTTATTTTTMMLSSHPHPQRTHHRKLISFGGVILLVFILIFSIGTMIIGMETLETISKTNTARKVEQSIALVNESHRGRSTTTLHNPSDTEQEDEKVSIIVSSSHEVTIPTTTTTTFSLLASNPSHPFHNTTCNVSYVYPVIFGKKPSHHNVSNLFRGHDGLETMEQYKTLPMKKAICQFYVAGQAFQMAHGMQQLYRCIAWWREYPHLPWVLVWRIDPKKGLNRYLSGMIQAYQDALNVSLVEETTEPRVTALISHTTRSVQYVHYAMRNPDDAAFLRDTILSYYQLRVLPTDNTNNNNNDGITTTATTRSMVGGGGGGCQPNKHTPVIGLLDRIENRKIINVEELVQRLEQEFGRSVKVTYFEKKSFLEQLQFMSQVDILLSSHGAQLVSIPFMPQCGGIIEFFQRGYFLSYYFGSLAAMSNLTYSYLYTGWNTTLERRQARGEYRRQRARERNICLNVDAVIHGVREMIDKWQNCCHVQI